MDAPDAAGAKAAAGVAVPLAMATGGEQLLACPGGCGHTFSASRLVFHLRSFSCAAAVGGPSQAVQAAAAVASAAGAAPPGKGPLLCPGPGCKHASPNLKALRKHYAACHGTSKHVCARCKKSFGRSDLLSRHAKGKCSPGVAALLACVCSPGTLYTTPNNLNRHIRAKSATSAPGERHERLRAPEEEEAAAGAAGAAQPEALPPPAGAPGLPEPEFNLLPT